MFGRFKLVGVTLMVAGTMFLGVGGYTYLKTADGAESLAAFSAAQDVRISYNEAGQLVDRGETAGAEKIMALLTEDWGYPVVAAELDPSDPVVNTASEYMYQMATIAYHTLHTTVKVTVPADVEYKGETFKAGEYEFVNDGRYWTQFDRAHPIEGPARAAIWTGTAHALIGELGVGTVTASALQMGLGIAAIAAALGATLLLAGAGLIWAARAAEAYERTSVRRGAAEPVLA